MVKDINQRKAGGESISGMGRYLWAGVEVSERAGVPVGLEEI